MKNQIEKIETKGLPLEEVKIRALLLKNLFTETFLKFKESNPTAGLSISGEPLDCSIFFIGNKTHGSDYDLNTHKEVPIYKCKLNSYVNYHTLPNLTEHYLDMRINFGGSMSSEDWRLDQDSLIDKINLALTNAAKDFLISEENTL